MSISGAFVRVATGEVIGTRGRQSGKTVIGPPWLFHEIQRRGPGDYLVGAPSFPLMSKKVPPEFLRLFRRYFAMGEYVPSNDDGGANRTKALV